MTSLFKRTNIRLDISVAGDSTGLYHTFSGLGKNRLRAGEAF